MFGFDISILHNIIIVDLIIIMYMFFSQADTTRVIFSWNEADPANDDPNEVMYHGPTNRGSLSVNLLGGQQDAPPDPVDVLTLEITVSNVGSLLHVDRTCKENSCLVFRPCMFLTVCMDLHCNPTSHMYIL